jgi:hypothetical protein
MGFADDAAVCLLRHVRRPVDSTMPLGTGFVMVRVIIYSTHVLFPLDLVWTLRRSGEVPSPGTYAPDGASK